MRPRPLPFVSVLMLGVALGPLAATSTAQADPRPGWVDPPAKAAPATPETPSPGAAKTEVKPDGPAEAGPTDKAGVKADAPASTTAERAPSPDAKPPSGQSPSGDSRIASTPARPATRPASRHLARRAPGQGTEPRIAATGASDPRFTAWAGAAQRLTLDYLDATSASTAEALAAVPRFYATRVRRFGHVETQGEIVAEKRRFAARWPERRYEARSAATRTACSAEAAACIVHATLDYRTGSPARGARAQGTAELVLEISFAGSRPVIVSETSRVLRRMAAASGPGGA